MVSAQALFLKHWLSRHTWVLGTLHNPEEEARKRELYAQGVKRWAVPNLFELLPVVMQFSVFCFSIGAFFAMFVSNSPGTWTVGIVTFIGILYWWAGYWIVRDSYTPFTLSRRPVLKMIRTWTEYTRRSMHEKVLNRDDAHVAILNRLFTHTSMTPNNSSILIQLFSLPVEYPQIRTKSLAPWSALSSLLPSMLMEMYSHPGCNLLPVLRLCLLVSDRGQSEQLLVNKEAKRAYSTIKTSSSNPLQNLYLHLLLSQLHATAGDTNHWQDACGTLVRLEYSAEHTSELVWLVDSIQLYTLWIEEDFTTRIVEFLRGVVVYLAKCPGDEHNGDLLRTAIIMAAEWLMSRQSPDNESLPRRWFLSSSDVRPLEGEDEGEGEGNRKMFVLVKDQRLPPSESLRRTINLYQDSQKTDSSSGFIIRTLLILFMAIESFAAENNGESISDAVPRIQRGDLRCALEGLWDLWEGGFNDSDLLRFVLTFVVPLSSPVGDKQSSIVIPLLEEYLQQVNDSPALITENAFRFLDAALEHSMTTGTSRDELELQLQDVQLPNPWFALHIYHTPT